MVPQKIYIAWILLIFFLVYICTLAVIQSCREKLKQSDEGCDRNEEWESIGNHTFFKRASAFYFVDSALLRLHYMGLSNRDHSFTLQVIVLKDGQVIAQFDASQILNQTMWQTGEYYSGSLTAYLSDLYIDKNSLSSYQMKVIVGDSVTQEQTDTYINVKIKSLISNPTEKKGSLLCTKCFNTSNNDHYYYMKWWMDLDRETGFDKIIMCDQRVNPTIDSLFKEFEVSVETITIKFLPTFESDFKYSQLNYLKSDASMSLGDNKQADNNKMNCIDMLILNECYLDNIDKYT